MRGMIIAVDGPTASGKGTIAKRLAEHYRLKRLDTGSLYRAVGLAVLDAGGDPTDEKTAVAAAEALDLQSIDEHRIRSAVVGAAASVVANIPAVRIVLRKAQRIFANDPHGAVLDGRDIGTVICPDAQVKFYVTADPSVRVGRRPEFHPQADRASRSARAPQPRILFWRRIETLGIGNRDSFSRFGATLRILSNWAPRPGTMRACAP